MKKSRKLGFLIIVFTYILVTFLEVTVYYQRPLLPFWQRLLLADIVATILIYLIGLVFNNATIYDPYWSVQPMVLVCLFMIDKQVYSMGAWIFFLVILFWGARLTINWCATFSNLEHQDWRYDMLKKKSGSAYFIVNLFGIHLFPTIIVFACMMPFLFFLEMGGSYHVFMLLGVGLALLGVSLEIASDRNMHEFQKTRTSKNEIIRVGFWKYSRHPNYLGEITFWWGIYCMAVVVYPSLWITFVGPLFNTLMFVFISIPLAEQHLAEYKDDFDQYRSETSMLLPMKKKSV